jgi:HAE1 family hydrophobic/amphiphilic exporter-1
VILGGLAISTIFTIFMVPSLLSFFIHREKNRLSEEEVELPSSAYLNKP